MIFYLDLFCTLFTLCRQNYGITLLMGLGQYQGGGEILSSISDSSVKFGEVGGIMGPRCARGDP